MASAQVSAVPDHIPFFITAPGQTDVLFALIFIVLLGAILAAGVFFFWLHSLPERMVHNRAQFDVVAVLVLLSLFTHIHAFWVAALILALIKFPDISFADFSRPLDRIANSLEAAAENQKTENQKPKPVDTRPASPPNASARKERVKHA